MRRWAFLLLAAAAAAQETPLQSGERKFEGTDFEGAVADFTKAIKGAPGDAAGYVGRGRALQMLDKDAEAVADFTKAIELAEVPDPTVFVRRAYSRFALGDHDLAISDCDRAIQIVPDDATAYYLRGRVRRAKREDAAAVADFDEVIRLEAWELGALRARAEANEALRRFADALADYSRLVDANRGEPGPLLLRGFTKLRLLDHEGALKDFDACLLATPENPGIVRVASARALLALGKRALAEAELAKAAEPPAGPDTFAERGRLYFDVGRFEEAVADLSKAVEIDPKGQDYPRLYLFLAKARLGQRALAAGELRRYLDGRETKDDWYSKVATFLCCQLKEEELLEAAKSRNPQIAIERECEAFWYAGAVRLLGGDAPGARALFERCVASDVRTFIEYDSAKMALAAMK